MNVFDEKSAVFFKKQEQVMLTLPGVGGAIWPPYPILGNFWPFFEKMAIIQKQLYFNPFLHKNHPWHNFLVKNFSNPQKFKNGKTAGRQLFFGPQPPSNSAQLLYVSCLTTE